MQSQGMAVYHEIDLDKVVFKFILIKVKWQVNIYPLLLYNSYSLEKNVKLIYILQKISYPNNL
jgi:hypothetical protein